MLTVMRMVIIMKIRLLMLMFTGGAVQAAESTGRETQEGDGHAPELHRRPDGEIFHVVDGRIDRKCCCCCGCCFVS